MAGSITGSREHGCWKLCGHGLRVLKFPGMLYNCFKVSSACSSRQPHTLAPSTAGIAVELTTASAPHVLSQQRPWALQHLICCGRGFLFAAPAQQCSRPVSPEWTKMNQKLHVQAGDLDLEQEINLVVSFCWELRSAGYTTYPDWWTSLQHTTAVY